jgi:hypothetical protein
MRTLRRRLERWASSRWAAPCLFVLALLVYVVEARGWPLQRGRDSWDYFIYYLSLLDGETPFRLVMLMRSPVTSIAVGAPMQLGGAVAMETVMALCFAVFVVAWAAVGARYSPLAGMAAAALVLVQPTFAIPFHEVSSDFVAATGFALLTLGVVRTLDRPGTMRFTALGLGVTALVLTRPAYEVLAVAVVLPFLTRARWRTRAVWAAAFLAAVVIPLGAFALHNDLRYGELTVSRAGVYNIPWYPVFRAGDLKEANGPASERLAGILRRDVLTLPPYKRLDVDVETYFETRSNFEAVRLAGLVDRIDGIGTDYGLLADAAREVPGDGFRPFGIDVRRSLDATLSLAAAQARHEPRLRPKAWPVPPPTVVAANGKQVPNPAVLGIPPTSLPFGFLACATNEIERCIRRDARVTLTDPSLAGRYGEVTATVTKWDHELGGGHPNVRVATQLDRLERHVLPAWLWALIAIGAVVWRRPRRLAGLAWMLAVPWVVLVVHAIGVGPDLLYALPVVPAFVVAAVCALFGARGTVTPTSER